MTPKYRTDSLACSCPGYWFRRTCKHYRAYREAMALVEAQNTVNVTFGIPEGAETSLYGPLRGSVNRE